MFLSDGEIKQAFRDAGLRDAELRRRHDICIVGYRIDDNGPCVAFRPNRDALMNAVKTFQGNHKGGGKEPLNADGRA